MKKTVIYALLTFTLILSFGCRTKDPEIGTDENSTANNSVTTVDMPLTPEKGDTIATLKTSEGDIKILLYSEKAPETVKNFTELASQGKYKNTIFHRIIDDFMVQGGDIENKNGYGGYSYKGPGSKLMDEFGKGLKHVKGAVSMANGGPNTGGSQFFIVQREGGTDWLDGKHAIFGYVYEGMDVVDKMAKVDTDANDKPLKDIVLEEVEVSTF